MNKFIGYLPEGGEILDVGCGSGRDSKYFIERGFDVTAIDGSEELCKLATIHLGQSVLNMKFSELNFKEVFDGVWACASLLHCTPDELDENIKRVINCIKPDGIFYMSFKYGDFSGLRNGRYYIDFKTRTMKDLISKYKELRILEIWNKPDVRAERENDIWINVLMNRTAYNLPKTF